MGAGDVASIQGNETAKESQPPGIITPRHGCGKLDTFSGSSKFDYKIDDPAKGFWMPHICTWGENWTPIFQNCLNIFPMGIPPLPLWGKILICA